MTITSKPFIIGATAVAVASSLGGYVWHQEHRAQILEAYVFDLKSGWSVFVRTPDDKRILINGGVNSQIIRELTTVLPFYTRRIDTVIVTDTEGKDVSGLIDVLDRYDVGNVVIPAFTAQSLGLASATDEIYATLIDTVERLKIPVAKALEGDAVQFGPKVSARILFPAATTSFQYSKASAPELIMRVVYGNTSFVLLGNATTKVQKYIAKDLGISADVLVVPHAISASALSSDLVDAMRPEYVVYSAATASGGKGRVATSSSKDKKLDPLYFILSDSRFNVREKGTVKIVSDGNAIKVE